MQDNISKDKAEKENKRIKKLCRIFLCLCAAFLFVCFHEIQTLNLHYEVCLVFFRTVGEYCINFDAETVPCNIVFKVTD